jgi:hypothetical protein
MKFALKLIVAAVSTGFMAWLLLSRQQAFSAAYAHARLSAFVWVTTIALGWVAAGLRAVRLALLLRERPSLEHAQISSFHSVAATLLPAKLGEFVLPALLRQRGTPLDASLGLLFLGRLLDLGVVLAVVAMALLGWGSRFCRSRRFGGGSSACLPAIAALAPRTHPSLAITSRTPGPHHHQRAAPTDRCDARALGRPVVSASAHL